MVKNLPANTADSRDVGSIPGSGRSPEKEMATHSSILAWRIPWTEESCVLQSIEWQRVKHDCSDFAHTHTHTILESLHPNHVVKYKLKATLSGFMMLNLAKLAPFYS